MIYILNSAFFALSAWNRERFCALFHAESADYAEIFSAVFVVALLGYVLRSLRSQRGIGKGSVLFFHAEAADYAEIFSAVCAVAGLVASFATTEVAEVGMTGFGLFHAEVGMR